MSHDMRDFESLDAVFAEMDRLIAENAQLLAEIERLQIFVSGSAG